MFSLIISVISLTIFITQSAFEFQCNNISIYIYSPSWQYIDADGNRSIISINDENNLVVPSNGSVAMRGHHIVVINEITGDLIDSITFDTYWGTEDALMYNYLNSIQKNRIVAISIDDTGHNAGTSYTILQAWGCTASKPEYREPFIFIGTASNTVPNWQYCQTGAEGTYLSRIFNNIQILLSIEMYSPSSNQINTDLKRSIISINGGKNLVVNGSNSGRQRGHNVVIISQYTGDVISSDSFDTYDGSGDSLMANYLESVEENQIVAITVDDSSRYASVSHSILQSWGCTAAMPGFRQPFIFIGTASNITIPSWTFCQLYLSGTYAEKSFDIQISNILIKLYSPSIQQIQSDGIRGMISINDGMNLVVPFWNDTYPWWRRGHHIVVINEITGDPIDSKTFDTWTNGEGPDDIAMAAYLNSIQENRIVSIVISDTGEDSATSHLILQSWGCNVAKPVPREPFVFVGSASSRHFPDWQYCSKAVAGTYLNTTVDVEICGGSFAPTSAPSTDPTNMPTSAPTDLTSVPTVNPTIYPTINPTPAPTNVPTKSPTNNATIYPTSNPTSNPTANPTTANPTTANPTTANPTTANPTTANPTANPTIYPTINPTTNPTTVTLTTANPTTTNPTTIPTSDPTKGPTNNPNVDMTSNPTANPTTNPTTEPTFSRSATDIPTISPKVDNNTDLTINVNATNSIIYFFCFWFVFLNL